MTIPAGGWLVLPRVTGERPPQHSDKQPWVGLGVQAQAFSSDCPHGVGIAQSVRRMVASEEAD